MIFSATFYLRKRHEESKRLPCVAEPPRQDGSKPFPGMTSPCRRWQTGASSLQSGTTTDSDTQTFLEGSDSTLEQVTFSPEISKSTPVQHYVTFVGKHGGKSTGWMDATGKEVTLWQQMLDRPNR